MALDKSRAHCRDLVRLLIWKIKEIMKEEGGEVKKNWEGIFMSLNCIYTFLNIYWTP